MVILLAVIMSYFYPAHAGAMKAGFSHPIIALEFASSFSDANLLFADDTALIQRFQIGHQLDMLFLVAYGAFLACANLGAWYCKKGGLSLIGIIAAGVAASSDCAENLQLMQLTEALLGQGGAPDFWLLRLFVSTKFLMISISMLCLVPLMWNRGWLGGIFASATVLLAPATLLTLSGYFIFSSAMTSLTVLAWICLLLWALKMRNGLPSVKNTATLKAQTS